MKKLYQKSEISFSVVWIVVYCVLMSLADGISAEIGIGKFVSLPVAIAMSAVLFFFIKKNGLCRKYGICKPDVKAGKMLYYIPLALLLFVNIMCGITDKLSVVETALSVLTMLFVGFLEEIIFRGLLFKAMAKESLKAAVIVSSVTFGMGHIINFFNGSGAELVPNLLQVIYAVAAGFMFVTVFLKSGSLIPCIVAHGLFNAVGVFSNEGPLTHKERIVSCIFLVAVSGFYSAYLVFTDRNKEK